MLGGIGTCRPSKVAYNARVAEKPPLIHVGVVIERARERRGWNQEQLGDAARRFALGKERRINKSTVSRIERNPYGSDLATVWRLLAALGLSFCDVEKEIGTPFEHPDAPERRSRAPASEHSTGKRHKRVG